MPKVEIIFHSILVFIKRYWVALTILNVIVVTTLSLTPLEHLPSAPGGDKTHHLISYCLLIIPCALF